MGDYIYASTLRNSLFVLKVDNAEIRTVQADGMTRPSTCHFSCCEDCVIVADKNKNVVGLRKMNNFSSTMATSFRLELPSVITKIKELSNDNNDGPSSCAGKTLMLSGAGGALYCLKYLTMQETRFLRDILHYSPMDFTPESKVPIYPGLEFRDSFMDQGVYDGDLLIAEHGDSLRLKDIIYNGMI
jgi:hypothetical protein